MTNSQLVELISNGDNNDLITMLWDRMAKLYRVWANNYYIRHKERCKICGVTADDLYQEGFLSMLEAVKAYANRTEEHKNTLFTSFCKFPFRKHAAALIGARTQRERKEPLNSFHDNIDEPFDGIEGETIGTTTPDPEAEQPYRNVEQADYYRAVRETVTNTLKDKPRELEAIERLYYNNETLTAAGEAMGVTPERVRQLKGRAFWHLKNSRELKKLTETNYYIQVSAKSCIRQGSAVEQIAERNETLLNAIKEKYNLVHRGDK